MDKRPGSRRQIQKDSGIEIVSLWNVNSVEKIGYLRFLSGQPIPYGLMLAIRNARGDVLGDMPRSASAADKKSMVDSIHADFMVREERPGDRPLRYSETREYHMNLREKRKRERRNSERKA